MSGILTATVRPETADVLLTVQHYQDTLVSSYQINAGWVGWSKPSGVTVAAPDPGDPATAVGPVTTGQYFGKTYSSLTVGAVYRFMVVIDRLGNPPPAQLTSEWSLGVVGVGSVAIDPSQYYASYEWTATATSHTVRITYNGAPTWTFPSGASPLNDELLFREGTTTPDTGEAYTPVSFLRTDANGTNPVRLLEGQGVEGGTMIVADAEAALVGAITYELRTPEGEVLTASADFDGTVTDTVLTVAVFPVWAITPDLVTGYDAASESQSTVHRIIGRPDPVVSIGVLDYRTGNLEIWCPDHASARAVREMYGRGDVVQLRQVEHEGLDMYHVPTRVTVEPYSDATIPRRWRVSVAYVEVAWPRGPLLGQAGWSYDDVLATYPSYDAVFDAFATYNDLTVGPA